MVLSYGVRLATTVASLAFPAYFTFKALEGEGPTVENERRQWLIYWLILAAFSLIEAVADVFLFCKPLCRPPLFFLVFMFLCYVNSVDFRCIEKYFHPFSFSFFFFKGSRCTMRPSFALLFTFSGRGSTGRPRFTRGTFANFSSQNRTRSTTRWKVSPRTVLRMSRGSLPSSFRGS
jgi:hypothetical protein